MFRATFSREQFETSRHGGLKNAKRVVFLAHRLQLHLDTSAVPSNGVLVFVGVIEIYEAIESSRRCTSLDDVVEQLVCGRADYCTICATIPGRREINEHQRATGRAQGEAKAITPSLGTFGYYG